MTSMALSLLGLTPFAFHSVSGLSNLWSIVHLNSIHEGDLRNCDEDCNNSRKLELSLSWTITLFQVFSRRSNRSPEDAQMTFNFLLKTTTTA
ncbi:hypothetical protein DFH06DRAFT_1240535, partial [Mycena polygramma]